MMVAISLFEPVDQDGLHTSLVRCDAYFPGMEHIQTIYLHFQKIFLSGVLIMPSFVDITGNGQKVSICLVVQYL